MTKLKTKNYIIVITTYSNCSSIFSIFLNVCMCDAKKQNNKTDNDAEINKKKHNFPLKSFLCVFGGIL